MAQQDGEDRIGMRPELPQTSNTPPQAAVSGYKIAIRRTGRSVEITLTSNDEYASIELYDSLVQSVGRGSLHLELKQ